MIREQVQNNAIEAIKVNDYRGIVDVSPRVGKSKILIDSIKDKDIWKIAICSPYKSIQNSWENEFEKWKLPYEVLNICSRSLDKIPRDLDLLVIDEVQTLSTNQISTIIKKTPKRILGLSGTLSTETKWNLRTILKLNPIFTYSIEQAIEDGIISNFEIVLVSSNLNTTHRVVTSGTKKKPLITTEKGHYDFLTSQFEKFRKLSYKDASYVAIKELYARQRMNFIYMSDSKLKIAKKIVDNNKRCIVFTGRTEQAEMLCESSYHSKNKKEKNLDKFIDGDIDKLAVIEMSSMGITIPNLKVAIIHQMKSNSEMSLQKVLRVCNLEDDIVAQIYVTYYKDTVDYKWTREAFAGVDERRIKEIDESDLERELSNP